MNTIIYILSISLQLTGALLVLFFAVSTKRQYVLKSFANSNVIFRDNNTKEIYYNHNNFKETYRTAYLSKWAFIFIALGYFLGVFGSVEWEYEIVVGIAIILLTVIIMCITYWSIDYVVKHSDKVNKEITNEELEELDIEPDIENISNDVIDGYFSCREENC